MIGLIGCLFTGLSVGTFIGSCLNRCPAGGNHDWKFDGIETRNKEERSTAHYEMGEYDAYETIQVKQQRFICKKCGKIKYI